MTEQLHTPIHDTPTQPTIAEAIKLISAVIDPEIAKRMLQEYQDGQALIAEDARLEADTAECIQHQQLVAEQIQKNDQRRQDLAPQLADALQKEADLRVLIEGLAKLAVRDEPVIESVAVSREMQPSPALPPLPPRAPKQPIGERRSIGEFRNTTVQRSVGRVVLIRGVLDTAVRGKRNEQ